MKTLHSMIQKIRKNPATIITVLALIILTLLFTLAYSDVFWSHNKENYKQQVLEDEVLKARIVSSMYYLTVQELAGKESINDSLSREELGQVLKITQDVGNQGGTGLSVAEQIKQTDSKRELLSSIYSGYLSTKDWLIENPCFEYYLVNETSGRILTNNIGMEQLEKEHIEDTLFSNYDQLYQMRIRNKLCYSSPMAGGEYLCGKDLAEYYEEGHKETTTSDIEEILHWTDNIRLGVESDSYNNLFYIGVKDIKNIESEAMELQGDYDWSALLWFYMLELAVLLVGILVTSYSKRERKLLYNPLEIPVIGVIILSILLPILVIHDMLNLFDQARNLLGGIPLLLSLGAVFYSGSVFGTMRKDGWKQEVAKNSFIGRWYALEMEKRSHIPKKEGHELRMIKLRLLGMAILYTILGGLAWYGINYALRYEGALQCISYVIYGIYLIIVWAIWWHKRSLIPKQYSNYQLLLRKTKEMAEGQIGTYITEDLGMYNPLRDAINHISVGLEKAVQDALSSQSMKTELITNVSHDLKTPLTSIVSYVDLLKSENLTDRERKEYIDILEAKSARLKKLIEDLFEMSKAVSKDVRLSVTNLNIVSLTREVLVEYEKAFDEKNLKVNVSFISDTIKVNLDGQKTYRIISNLVGNIVKYTMPHTRVYVLITKDEENVMLEFKNISATEITHQGEELTERFVREDSSRNTEGSGLGLAIAKSLTELQDGVLSVEADGDLFKVRVSFPLAGAPEGD